MSTTIAVLALVALCGPCLLWLGRISSRRRGSAAQRRWIYQACAVPLAIAIFAVVRRVVPDHSSVALAGDLSAPAIGLGWLGVDGESWGTLLLTVGGIVVVVTAVTLWVQVGRPSGIGVRPIVLALPAALALALVNAAQEELIFRVALVEGTAPAVSSGAMTALFVAVWSGVTFGLPHWFGLPRGPLGAALAGFLGWLAATATMQTGGIAWAWIVHVALDVVIFSVALPADDASDALSTTPTETAP